MDHIVILENPENIRDIAQVQRNRRFLSRFCIQLAERRNIFVVLLCVVTMISLLTQLPLHMQSKRYGEQINLLAKEILTRRVDGDKNDDVKTRLARTATSATPHFYLEGWTSNSDIDATDGNGIFRWKAPPARSFDQGTDFFHADKTSGYLTKVTIVRPGVYFVFAKVTANGRYPHQSDMTPPVGVRLMKNNEVLDVAWTTQDERGKVYSSLRSRRNELDRFPLDTLTIFGLHALDVNDNIYIQRPPEKPYNEPDRFLTGRNRQQFGMFLVENCLNC